MSDVTFWLRPAEALHFGPPRSFQAGEAHRSRSLFPPPPMAFQGLVRTRLLCAVEPPLDLSDRRGHEARARVTALVGGPDALPEGWQLEGPLPVELDEDGALVPWLPTPGFLLGRPSEPPHREAPVPAPVEPFAFDDRAIAAEALRWVGAPQAPYMDALDGWISASNLRWALSGQGAWDPRGFERRLPPFVRYETQAGLAVERGSGTAKEQMLYFLDTLRFRTGAGLLGRLAVPDGAPVPLDALTRGAGVAGRKSRVVTYEAAPPLHDDWAALRQGRHLPDIVEDGAACWLVSLGPCERDPQEQEELLAAQAPGLALRVLARRLAPPVTLGGLRVDGSQRDSRIYAGGGSALCVTISGGGPAERAALLQKLNGACILAKGADRAFGLGQVLCGVPFPARSP